MNEFSPVITGSCGSTICGSAIGFLRWFSCGGHDATKLPDVRLHSGKFGKGTACFLYPTPNAGTSKASQAFWQVDDVAREVAELKSRGVAFEDYDMPGTQKGPDGIVTAGGAKAAWFRDTEGNILALIQEL